MAKNIIELANIDKICKRFSMEIAKCETGNRLDGTQLQSLNPRVTQLLKRHGMTGGFGPIRSSFRRNGRIVEFISMIQSFEITSEELFELAKDLAYHLWLEVRQEEIGEAIVRVSYGFDAKAPLFLNEACFAYSGNEFMAITLPEKKIVTLRGSNNGTANHEGQYIFLNVISGDLNSLIHEVLHLKVAPDAFQKNDTPILQIGSKVSSLIQERNPDKWEEWRQKLEFARMKALESFRALNDDLGKVIPNDWQF